MGSSDILPVLKRGASNMFLPFVTLRSLSSFAKASEDNSPYAIHPPIKSGGILAKESKQGGFTIAELVVVMAVFSLLSAVITVNLLGAKYQTSLNTFVTTLISDLNNQQMKAVLGDTEGSMLNNDYGIYFEPNRYIHFQGSSFNAGNPDNFIVNLEDDLEFTNITFLSSKVVFAKGSGEIVGFADGSNTITIKNTLSQEAKIITLNRYGVVTGAN